MTDHLTKATKELLLLSDEERIHAINSNRWIGYPRAKQILSKLEELLAYPQIDRMPNLLIVGDTNNGKTSLLRRFCQQHPAYDNPGSDYISVPVLYIICPPKPNEARFYDTILNQLFAKYKTGGNVGDKEQQVLQICKEVGVKMLILDEASNILAGSSRQTHEFLTVIRNLGNNLKIPIVAAGIREAYNAIQIDPQLANRFDVYPLPRWRIDDTDYERLLASFEALLPLKEPSFLASKKMSRKLFVLTDGYIGELSRLLNKVAVEAINTGAERITFEMLDSIDWVAPSERKKQADALLRFE